MDLNVQPKQLASSTAERWRKDYASLIRDLFRVDPLPDQLEALKALNSHGHVSIRSGHGCGKTALLSWSIISTMLLYFPTTIPCTAPTGHQLDDILWKELARWHQAMPEAFRQMFEIKSRLFVLKHNPDMSFAVGRTASKGEGLQGFHLHKGILLFVIDEGSGIDDGVFEVAQGALSTKSSRVLMASNPTRRSGFFYDTHHSLADEFHCFHWNSEKSPIVQPSYCERMSRLYGGRSSNAYRVRVLGEFPKQDDDSVVDYDSVVAAQGRDVEQTDAPMLWGVDVARGGKDRSALSKRKGNVMPEAPKYWLNKDSELLAEIIAQEYEETKVDDRPEEIIVDLIGLGAGVFDNLYYMGLPVQGVNVAERASIHDRYNRLRDELWVRCARWFSSKAVSIPTIPEMDMNAFIQELTAVRYAEVTSQGKVRVESKADMTDPDTGIKLKSPDLADSFILTFRANLRQDAILSPNARRKWRRGGLKFNERPRLKLL